MVHSIFDEVEEYIGLIVDGVYYLETEQFFPARGNGWYTRVEVEYFQEIGIQYKIV